MENYGYQFDMKMSMKIHPNSSKPISMGTWKTIILCQLHVPVNGKLGRSSKLCNYWINLFFSMQFWGPFKQYPQRNQFNNQHFKRNSNGQINTAAYNSCNSVEPMHFNFNKRIRDRPIFRTDLQIWTTFGLGWVGWFHLDEVFGF